tara:strand:- start:315 stop:473 length:159 start_codon:yes stop_codon:yes gene_type:complete
MCHGCYEKIAARNLRESIESMLKINDNEATINPKLDNLTSYAKFDNGAVYLA